MEEIGTGWDPWQRRQLNKDLSRHKGQSVIIFQVSDKYVHTLLLLYGINKVDEHNLEN